MDDNSRDFTPDEVAMMADLLDLETSGLTSVENGILTKVHSPETCAGRPGGCWVHRPSDWALAGGTVYWSDTHRMAYRRCGCTSPTLHPDLDAVAFAARGRTIYAGRVLRPEDPEFHDCCPAGCCGWPYPISRPAEHP